MSWSAAFSTLLQLHPHSVAYVLENLAFANGEAFGTAGVLAASYSDHGDPIFLEDVSITGQSVSIQTWSFSHSTATVNISMEDAATFAASVRRGSLVRILAGSRDWDITDFQPVFLGFISGIRSDGKDRVAVDLWGLLAALQTRRAKLDYSAGTLFCNAGDSTTLNGIGGYVPGDTTIDVADESVFELETGGVGAVRIDSSLSATSFYLTYTGTAAGQLTGVSAAGQFHSTEAVAAPGDSIVNIVYLRGHPVTIAKKLLMSTGAGTNGTFDTYPETWAFGIDSDLVDTTDMNDVRDDVMVVGAGTYQWDILIDGSTDISSAIDWYQGLLSQAGAWLCIRQGMVSIRAVQSPNDILHDSGVSITDTDIISASCDWWDPSQPTAYQEMTVAAYTNHVDTGVSPAGLMYWPTAANLTYDLAACVLDNETEIVTEVRDRLQDWAVALPESVQLTLRGAHRGVVPGDIVHLTTAQIRGRLASTYDGYTSRACMVVDATSDIDNTITIVRLAVLPVDLADEWVPA